MFYLLALVRLGPHIDSGGGGTHDVEVGVDSLDHSLGRAVGGAGQYLLSGVRLCVCVKQTAWGQFGRWGSFGLWEADDESPSGNCCRLFGSVSVGHVGCLRRGLGEQPNPRTGWPWRGRRIPAAALSSQRAGLVAGSGDATFGRQVWTLALVAGSGRCGANEGARYTHAPVRV